MEPPRPLDEILDLPGVIDTEWIDPPMKTLFVGVTPPEELRPRYLLFVNGMYLVATIDEPGTWWMGEEREGIVRTWGRYGPLERAIAGL